MIIRIVVLISILASLAKADPVFRREVIDSEVIGGKDLDIADVDGDGRADVLLADKWRFAWYANPDWKDHTLARNITLRDNICIAAQDIDGDGRAEIAVGSRWNPSNTTERLASGSVHYLDRPGDPREEWTPVELFHDPTVHRMRWIQGADGRYRLVVLPLHGIGNREGEGSNGVKVRVYQPNLIWLAQQRGWSHQVIDRSLRQAHGFDNEFGVLFIGGKEGIVRRYLTDGQSRDALLIHRNNTSPPTRGVSEVSKGKTLIAAIEPYHGNELVVYRTVTESGNRWKRQSITDQLNFGHALEVADFDDDGEDEIVVGWQERNASGTRGLMIFDEQSPGEWEGHWIDRNGIAPESIVVHDLDRDGTLDLAAVGGDTQNLVIYWNDTRREESEDRTRFTQKNTESISP